MAMGNTILGCLPIQSRIYTVHWHKKHWGGWRMYLVAVQGNGIRYTEPGGRGGARC
jgi:hypothetical protein